MKFFLDTANYRAVETWKDYVCGITTNPKLINNFLKHKDIVTHISIIPYTEKVKKVVDSIPSSIPVFVQIHNYGEFMEIAKGKDKSLIYKIPLIYPEGYDLAREIKKEWPSVSLCGTMTYDMVQLNMALNLDLDYCIILLHKNNNEMFLEEAVAFSKSANAKLIAASFDIRKKTKLIAASFRNKEEVMRAIESGVDFATVPPKIMEEIFHNKQADKDYENTYLERLE